MSSQSSLIEIQPAIYTKLTGDATLMAIAVGGVFDFGAVPANYKIFPYIAIGDSTEGPSHAFGTRGYLATLTLHIWDNTPTFQRCQRILAQMNVLLDEQSLTLATQHHVYTLYEFSASVNDPGLNTIRHMPVRYATFTQE